MSLDYLRAVAKTNGEAMTAVYEDIKGTVQSSFFPSSTIDEDINVKQKK